MSLFSDIKRDFSDLIPKSLPTFLNQAGEWDSSDGTLYQKPEVKPEPPKIVQGLLREFPRSVTELGLKALDIEEFKPETLAAKFLLGEEPIKKPVGKLETGIAALGAVPILPTGKKQVAKRIAKEVGEIAGKVERGFITSVKEVIPEMKVAGQYIPRSTDRLAIKAKNLIQSDIATAERIARNATDDDAVAIGSELIKHYGDEAAKATNEATKLALYDRGAEIANTMARNLTEQGRAVQAASILGRLTPEGQVRFAAREIQRYNEAIESGRGGILGLKKKVPELTGQQADEIITEMKAIEKMTDGTEKAIRFQELQNRIADLVPSSLYQKVVAVWKAGLLTGIKTSGLNIFSNISHSITEEVAKIPAAAVDSIASLFTGRRTLVLPTRRLGGGLREGIEKGWRYFKTGFDERNIGVKLDYRRVNFGKGRIAKGLQRYEETVFRALGTEDQPFYYGAKARSLANQGMAEAKNKGLTGLAKQKFVDDFVANPPDEAVRYAVLDAETAVFQNPTVLGRIARQIQKAPLGELVVPFGRTPSAVATQIINYSPIGIVNTIVRNIGKGRFDQRLFAQGIGRGLTGTAVLFVGWKLAERGLTSLDRPQTEREQELWKLEGRTPNSVKIGGKWRSPQILGPAGNLLLIGGHFQNQFSKSGSPTEAMMSALSGSAKSFTEQTFLRGVNQVVEALNDPARSAEGYLGSTLSSVIPTIVSDVARATDITERRSETILQRIQARIPILRQKLEPQITALGEEQRRAGNFLEVMADPTRPSKEFSTPVVQELRRLFNEGFKVSPTKLGDKRGFRSLTQEQNTDLWKRSGEITREKLARLFAHEEYQKLPDDLKAKKADDFVQKSKLVARVEKVLELTEGFSGQPLKDKLSELKKGGLLTREVYLKFMELR